MWLHCSQKKKGIGPNVYWTKWILDQIDIRPNGYWTNLKGVEVSTKLIMFLFVLFCFIFFFFQKWVSKYGHV